ncbi:MAG: cytochrome c, partial [Planctomycetota bacterium]
RHGIAGTTMKVIPELSEEDIQALVDYVIYLSLRGELERSLIDEAIFEGLLEDGLRIINRELGERVLAGEREKIKEEFAAWESADEPEDDPRAELDLELYDESVEIAEDILADIADEWFEAEDDVVDVPEPPAEILVADDYEQFLALKEGDQAETLASSVERGRELFTGKVASCSKCHGEQGKGDGQNKDYDDWTKDWTSRVGLDPTDFDSLVPLMARGAMPPKNARPRNLSEGIFRGGESAESLYRRIIQGIDGSPMPSSTFVPGQYEEDDIWHIINFIRSLRTTPVENG